MITLSKRLDQIEPSATLKITELAGSLRAEGKDVLGFGAGEPDFDTPTFIKEAAKKALDDGYTKYSPVMGYPELKKAIKKKLESENDFSVPLSQIIVSNGGKQALFNSFLVTLNEGDEVIIPAPYWPSYIDMVKMLDAVPVLINAPYESKYKITASQLENAITDKTKIFILNSPSNPTGMVYTFDELRKIADVLEKYPNILVITDDIYEKLLYDDAKFYNLAMVSEEIKQRTIIINGLSKAHSMTGWRIGYAASPNKDLIKAMNTVQGQITSGINSFSQFGAVAALESEQKYIKEMLISFKERRDFLLDVFSKIEGFRVCIPKGAFYLFVDIANLVNKLKANPAYAGIDTADMSAKFCSELLEKQLIAFVPGNAFGAPNSFRISYATSMENLKKGVERLQTYLSSL